MSFCGLLFKIINYQLWQLPILPTPPFLSQKVSYFLKTGCCHIGGISLPDLGLGGNHSGFAVLSAKNGAHCSRRGAGVNRLTNTRQRTETISAGIMASRCAHSNESIL